MDFLVSPRYSSHLSLLKRQSYLGTVSAWPTWKPQETAPMTPWSPFEETLHHEAMELPSYDHIVHLGYRAWPDRPLPLCIYEQTKREYPNVPVASLDLERAWIEVQPSESGEGIYAVGFSDEWFELKVGIYELLKLQGMIGQWVGGASRWNQEAHRPQISWEAAASILSATKVFLGCNSALHVLACSVGARVVMLEPNHHRYNDVFFPYGKTGRVHLVLGGDGQPTFDARHCADALKKALAEVSA